MSRFVYDTQNLCYVKELNEFRVDDILPKYKSSHPQCHYWFEIPFTCTSDIMSSSDDYCYNMIVAHFEQWRYSDELELLDFNATCNIECTLDAKSSISWYQPLGIPPQKVIQKVVEKFKNLTKINQIYLPVLLGSKHKQDHMYCDQFQFLEDIKILLEKTDTCTLTCARFAHEGTYESPKDLVKYLEKLLEMQIKCHIKIKHHALPFNYIKPQRDIDVQYMYHNMALRCVLEQLHDVVEWCKTNEKMCELSSIVVHDPSHHRDDKGIDLRLNSKGYTCTEVKGTNQYRKELSTCDYALYHEELNTISTWLGWPWDIVYTIKGTAAEKNVGGDGNDGDSNSTGGGGANSTGGTGDDGDNSDDGGDGDKGFVTATAAEYIPKTMKGKQPYHYWNLEQCRYKGEGKVVAIVDSGINETHPAFFEDGVNPLTSKIVLAVNFNDDKGYVTDVAGHGTVCAGVACGSGFETCHGIDRMEYPPGVAPKAKLVICKVRSKERYCHDAMVRAFEWIKEKCVGTNPPSGVHVDVVSYSIGRKTYSQKLERAISELIGAGVIVVCAASNDGHQRQQPIVYPARLGHVLCIGSHGAFGKPSEFSPVGQQIDFLAPGEDIVGPSRTERNAKIITSGTSYSSPAVAGLICVILECLGKEKDLQRDIRKHCKIADDQSNVFNQWVMKEILRRMATNAGIHLDNRGYGSLDPEEFFRNPAYFVKNALGIKK